MTITLSPAGRLTEAAIVRRDEAQAQAAEARTQAQAARSAAAGLQGRLHAGDASVTVEDIVNAGPEADRLTAIANLHDSTLPGFEVAIREARTDEVLECVLSEEILSREAHAARITDLAQQIADFVEPFERQLEPVAEQHSALYRALPSTTAFGQGFRYAGGNPYSPIRVDRDELSLDVEGTSYVMLLSIRHMIEQSLTEADRELDSRRTARASA